MTADQREVAVGQIVNLHRHGLLSRGIAQAATGLDDTGFDEVLVCLQAWAKNKGRERQ